VVSRLKEHCQRPVIAIAFDGARGTGSGRSVPGIDLGRLVRLAVDRGLLVRGGGHAMAAGLTIERDRLAEFKAFLAQQARETTAPEVEALLVDAVLSAQGLYPDLVRRLDQAGPFGAGNPEPLLAFAAHRLDDVAVVGERHVRVRASSEGGGRVEAIAFRAVGRPLGVALLAARGQRVHLVGHVSLDYWGGREKIQLRIVDMAWPMGDNRGTGD
jgi:single-stranded-DNA-specific exonuclease